MLTVGLLVAACSPSSQLPDENDDGGLIAPGTGAGSAGGASGSCGQETLILELIVRDFNASHLDMERVNMGNNDLGCGIVASELFLDQNGARTPQFENPIGSAKRKIEGELITCVPWDYKPEPEFTGEEYFNQWYSDVPGINKTFTVALELHADATRRTFVFDSDDRGGFFPADGKGFNELSHPGPHNFHFTTEAHVQFTYRGGEKFTFSGDDDMWIFVNNQLALDLGGQHSPLTATIDFDAQAGALGLARGQTYNMDIFHAERHTADSNYRVETSIDCFETVDVPTEVIR